MQPNLCLGSMSKSHKHLLASHLHSFFKKQTPSYIICFILLTLARNWFSCSPSLSNNNVFPAIYYWQDRKRLLLNHLQTSVYLWGQIYTGTEILKDKIILVLKFMKKPEDYNCNLHSTGRGFSVRWSQKAAAERQAWNAAFATSHSSVSQQVSFADSLKMRP